LANHFKKTGDRDRYGKVDYTKSEIVKLRTQTIAIRDIAQGAVGETDAAKRGITPARITALTAAIAAYTKVMNAPRGQIVNRSALIKEVETDTAALLEFINDIDDLVLQFDTSPTGHWLGVQGESYSLLQTELRRRFPDKSSSSPSSQGGVWSN